MRCVIILSVLLASAISNVYGQGDRRYTDAEYRIVFVYDKTDPLTPPKYKVYDVRQGEGNSNKLKAWTDKISFENPNIVAYSKDVYLSKESGLTDAEKVQSVIDREQKRIRFSYKEPIDIGPRAVQPVRPPRDLKQTVDENAQRANVPNIRSIAESWMESPRTQLQRQIVFRRNGSAYYTRGINDTPVYKWEQAGGTVTFSPWPSAQQTGQGAGELSGDGQSFRAFGKLFVPNNP